MKIILLYGSGEVAKREELLKIRRGFAKESVAVVDLKSASFESLQNICRAQSLFNFGQRLVIVENIPDKFELAKISSSEELTLVLLAGSLRADSILVKTAKQLKAQIITFEGEKEISAFPFLDSLIEGKKGVFLELEKLLEEYNWPYLLSMIYYLLRRNILPLPPAPFLQKKIKEQRNRFAKEDWSRLYYLVLETEYKIKSGLLESSQGVYFLTAKIIERRFG